MIEMGILDPPRYSYSSAELLAQLLADDHY